MTVPTQQRIVLLREFGGPEALAVTEQPVPEPGAAEVLVKVLAASVQFTDVMLRKGQYPDLKQKPPLVLGYDLVGEVVKLGPGVSAPKIGARVADLTMTGSYAQYRTLAAADCVAVDPALDPAQATTLVLSWLTAHQLLHRDAKVRKGQKLLVVGAAGAVGQALVVLGRLAGCTIWGSAGASHAELLRELGAIRVERDGRDFGPGLPAFDAVFDAIAEQGFAKAWRAVGPRGHLSAYGISTAIQGNFSLARIGYWFAKLWWWRSFSGARSTSFYSITALRKKHPDWFAADLAHLFELLRNGTIHPRIAERIGLDAVADAHVRIERGGLQGKIVLFPNGLVRQ